MTRGRGESHVRSGTLPPATPPGHNFGIWEAQKDNLLQQGGDPSAVFPLPPLGWKGSLPGLSKTAKRRQVRYRRVFNMTTDCIDGLHELYGCNRESIVQASKRPVLPCHDSVHTHVVDACLRCQPKDILQTPRAAARLLLGPKFEHAGTSTTVEAFDDARVSLPDEGVVPVPLASVLPSSMTATLCPDRMLADDDVVEYRQKFESVGLYTDVVLEHDKRKRVEFYKRLYKCGILGFSFSAKGKIAPFFVSKKNGNLRLVLDCRRVNQHFRKPHRPALGPAESLQRIENDSAETICEAEADLTLFLSAWY